MTEYDQLMSLWRQTGVMPAELAEAPELPALAAHVWDDFLDLHRARGSNGFGPAALRWGDMAAWAQVTGARLLPWEVGAIRALDAAYLGSLAKAKER